VVFTTVSVVFFRAFKRTPGAPEARTELSQHDTMTTEKKLIVVA
jgi:hypothetical protein